MTTAIDKTFNVIPVLTGQLQAVISQTDEAANELSSAIIGISRQAKSQVSSVQGLFTHLTEKRSNTHSIADTQGSIVEIQANFSRLISFFDVLLQRFSDITTGLSKINDIAGNISKIGQTTDILAINAAIEANSAGQAGAGFKVIATEIKGLAKDSNEAITQISDLIFTLSDSVASIQKEMERIRTDAGTVNDATNRLFNQTSDSLKSILDETAAKVSQISTDAEKLTSEIGRAVVSIQFQDITRQRIEHVVEPLEQLGDAIRATVRSAFETGGDSSATTSEITDSLMNRYTMESERTIFNKVTSQTLQEQTH